MCVPISGYKTKSPFILSVKKVHGEHSRRKNLNKSMRQEKPNDLSLFWVFGMENH